MRMPPYACDDFVRQRGFALLTALIALSLFSIIGLSLALLATSEVKTSDNYENHIQARAAAMAGLNHGRALLRGIQFDDLLLGPDGTYDSDPASMARARTHAFRLPVDWSAARYLDMLNPAVPLSGDDGIMNTGWHPSGAGLVLIPAAGIAQTAPNPYDPGVLVISRYFVKVTDNNGDESEIAADPAGNPFYDGDSQVILRSLGIGQTLSETTQNGNRRNSVVVFEARFMRPLMFDLDAALVVQSNSVEPVSAPMFSGETFSIHGGGQPGIATIDLVPGDGTSPAQQILSRLTATQAPRIQGNSVAPSISDITAAVSAHAEKRRIMDAPLLCNFLNQSLPQFADNIFAGSQTWAGSAPSSLGSYDPSQPQSAPGQNPKATLVAGDLYVDGSLAGGGLLVVAGSLTIRGNFSYSGLVLVLGGELDVGGFGTVTGSLFAASLSCSNVAAWGTTKLAIRDSCRVVFDRQAVRMALSLIPPRQLGFREITHVIDPE